MNYSGFNVARGTEDGIYKNRKAIFFSIDRYQYSVWHIPKKGMYSRVSFSVCIVSRFVLGSVVLWIAPNSFECPCRESPIF